MALVKRPITIDELERPFKVEEVKHLTGLHERTLRTMIRDGRLRVIRLPGVRRLRVPREEVERLLGQQPERRRRRRSVAV